MIISTNNGNNPWKFRNNELYLYQEIRDTGYDNRKFQSSS